MVKISIPAGWSMKQETMKGIVRYILSKEFSRGRSVKVRVSIYSKRTVTMYGVLYIDGRGIAHTKPKTIRFIEMFPKVFRTLMHNIENNRVGWRVLSLTSKK